MKKILSFGASNHKYSINQQLAHFIGEKMENADVTLLDLNVFEMPIFSIEREKQDGIPGEAHTFKEHITKTDGIIISLAEYNGSYSSAFKNIMDWVSRIEGTMWQEKPMFLLATSPGSRGGQDVLNQAIQRFPRMGGNIKAHFSLPFFKDNFSPTKGILDNVLNASFTKALEQFRKSLYTTAE